MASKKKDLEIVYNLQWKNRPIICDEKSNMVGMYDIPATTLNWDTFKSYLLKNSGTTGDDVKVSYINADDKEVAIESQMDFQVALYLFRQRARLGEIITLKLDRIVDNKKPRPLLLSLKRGSRQSTDVQTQVENKQFQPVTHEPPEWFIKYMKKFKEEMKEEIALAINNSNKASNIFQNSGHHSRKSKPEIYKRNRKTSLLLGELNNDREACKTIKLERKLENKLEKLEHKTMKIRAKKMALRVSSDSDIGNRGNTKSRPIGLPPSDSEILMNASAVTNFETSIPHMCGGETYLQQWKVVNSGKIPWTYDTELRYAWGSQAFTPVDKRVPCPHLSPGEEGTVAVLLEIPTTPGHYECYWHFHHNGRRFGHWLGCQVVVDNPPVKEPHYLPPTKYDVINIKDMYELVLPTSWTSSPKNPKSKSSSGEKLNEENTNEEQPIKINDACFPFEMLDKQKIKNEKQKSKDENASQDYETTMENINTSLQNLKLHAANAGCDSDNQSIISISDSNTSANSISSDEFVLVPITNTEENIEREHNILQKLSSNESSEKFNVAELSEVMQDSQVQETAAAEQQKQESDSNNNTTEEVSLTSSFTHSVNKQESPMDLSNKCVTKTESPEKEKPGYAYIHFNGQKIPIAKEYLRPDYLANAEEASPPEASIINPESIKKTQQSEFVSISSTFNESHCSATGSTFSDKTSPQNNSKRFFVFPQNYPGYEVINLPPSPYVNTSTYSSEYNPWMDIHREIVVNDWATGQNYVHNYPSCYSNYNPYTIQNNGSFEHVQSPQETPGVSFNGIQSPDGKCPYKINEHTLAGCNQSTCKLQNGINCENQSQSEAASLSSANSQQQSFSASQSQSTQNKFRYPAQSVPDNLLTGAAIVATSAMNTARNVLNMLMNPRNSNLGRWENGRWVSTNPESKREKSLRILNEMGFYNHDLNATLLARYDDDITRVIFELVQ